MLSAACDDDSNNTCAANDPVTKLEWLKEIIETYQEGTVDLTVEQATYRLRTVFVVTPCCPGCYTTYAIFVSPVYNCKGEVLEGLYSSDEGIRHRKVIWKTPAEEAECW